MRKYWNRLVAFFYRRSDKIDTQELAKKNVIFRRKKIFAIVVLVLVLWKICAIVLKVDFYRTQSDAGKAFIRSTVQQYMWRWSCSIDEEDNELTVYFHMKKGLFGDDNLDKYADSIVSIYAAVKDKFLADEKWSDYVVSLGFFTAGSSSPDYFMVNYIDRDDSSLEIKMDWGGMMDMRDIAENFPNTKSLYLDYIGDITDGLDGFKNLTFPSDYGITEEEREYVWSLFPECVIEGKSKELYYNSALEE